MMAAGLNISGYEVKAELHCLASNDRVTLKLSVSVRLTLLKRGHCLVVVYLLWIT